MAAAKRVETIAKRKSGAEELAMARRLSLLPKNRVVVVTLVRILISPEEEIIVKSSEEGLPLVRSEEGKHGEGKNGEGKSEEGKSEERRTDFDVPPEQVSKTPEIGSKGGLICCPQTNTSSNTTTGTATAATAISTSQPPVSQHLTFADRIRNSALTKCFVRARTYTYEVHQPPTQHPTPLQYTSLILALLPLVRFLIICYMLLRCLSH